MKGRRLGKRRGEGEVGVGGGGGEGKDSYYYHHHHHHHYHYYASKISLQETKAFHNLHHTSLLVACLFQTTPAQLPISSV